MGKKTRWLIKFLVLVTMLGFARFSLASDYPTKPIECLMPMGPGAVSAIGVKIITDAAAKILGKPILQVSALGPGGIVAGRRCAMAKPDGYTILASNSAINGTALCTRKDVGYENSDFEFLAFWAFQDMGLTTKPGAPFKTLEEFITYGKENRVKAGLMGVGTGGHMCFELLKLEIPGLKIDYVPAVSSPDMRMLLLGGNIDVAILMGGSGGSTDEFTQAIESGSRVIAVSSKERLKAFPNVPTYFEKGLNVVLSAWTGIVAPKGMPKEISEKLKNALYKALEDPQVIQGVEKLGNRCVFMKSEEFTKYVKEYENLIRRIVKEAKIPPI